MGFSVLKKELHILWISTDIFNCNQQTPNNMNNSKKYLDKLKILFEKIVIIMNH